MYIDGHLDLASNVTVHQRDLTRGVMAQRRADQWDAQELLVTLPELRRGDIGIVFGTLFTMPVDMVRPDGAPPLADWQKEVCYETPDEAYALAVDQLEIYEQWEADGRIRILRDRGDLETHVAAWDAGDRTIGLVVLMEGGDPIRTPDELDAWWDRGLRIVGPAWQRTRCAGGTSPPGPLTEASERLVRDMDERGMVLDVSHLAEEIVWRMEKKHHAGLIVRSPDRERAEELLRAYMHRFRDDFHASMPAPDRIGDE